MRIAICSKSLADISPQPLTARQHSPKKRAKLKGSIAHFGILSPILIHGRTIVDGHARYMAAQELNLSEVPTISTEGLSDADAQALRLAMNRLQEDVTWDPTVVHAVLKELLDLDYDLDLTAFDAIEIDSFMEINPDPSGELEEVDASSLADLAASATKTGDIWILGKHRIACGDVLDQVVRQALFKGRTADACFTDPPYNVRINGNVSGLGVHEEFAMASGEMTNPEFVAFLQSSVAAIRDHLTEAAVSFVCMDWRGLPALMEAAKSTKLEMINIAVWVKTNPGMGSLYRSQHEFVTILKREGSRHRNNVELGKHGRSRSNVWTYRGVNVMGPERPLLREHPTVKPAAMIADAIRDVTKAGDLVFDPFLGSGSTLIAADRTKRVCFGIEIEPRFVDLTIRRWQAETGRQAVREGDGMSFDQATLEAAVAAPVPDLPTAPPAIRTVFESAE